MGNGRERHWFVHQDGIQAGPMSLAELRGAIIHGAIVAGAQFRRGDGDSYRPGSDHAEIADLWSDECVLTTEAATPRAKKK